MSLVLDASAVLAYLHKETGWETVKAALNQGMISSVNWSEVAQKTLHRNLNSRLAGTLLQELGLRIIPFSVTQAEIAAEFWEPTHQHGLSLADRACLALAMEQDLPALTADTAWSKLNLPLEIKQLR